MANQTDKYRKRYQLRGILYCSKCGSTLKRGVWNSNKSWEKVIWQFSNYISNGKDACSGMVIEGSGIRKLNIKEGTVIKEYIKYGKKHYSYTSKRDLNKCDRICRGKNKKSSSLL